MSYFIFKGIDSRSFGITSKLTLPPVSERIFKTTEIPGRFEPLNRLDIMRKNIKIPITLSVPDVSRVGEINAWLQGKGDLILSDDITKKYHAYISSEISHTRLSRRFFTVPITFVAEPFRYSVDNPEEYIDIGLTDGEVTYSPIIKGTADCEPDFCFDFAGRLIIIVNGEQKFTIESSGEYTENILHDNVKEYVYNREKIYVDSSIKLAYVLSAGKKVVVTNRTWGMFPTLKSGRNNIEFVIDKSPRIKDDTVYETQYSEFYGFNFRRNERWY